MSIFLLIHTRYTDVQLALFKDTNLIEVVSDESKKISKNFIPLMRSLFKRNKLSLQDLTFIGAHQGPAPFTTLRVSLTFLNGLAFVTHLPLVGVNGLEVFLHEYHHPTTTTIALLNAFCQDIYYGVYATEDHKVDVSYGSAQEIIYKLASTHTGPVYFIGNGVTLYKQFITDAFGSRASIADPLPSVASLEAVANTALKKWQEKTDIAQQLMPLYMKGYSAFLAMPGSHCQPLK